MSILNKKHPELLATITDNLDLDYSVKRLFKQILENIGSGIKVRVEIRKWYKKRSLQQNRTVFGPDYDLILEYLWENGETGWTKEDIHHFHKERFLGYVTSKRFPGLYRLRSSTELDTKEFADEFRERYCRFWAENGLYIPDPVKKEG